MKRQLGLGVFVAVLLVSLVSNAKADVSLVFSTDGGGTLLSGGSVFNALVGDDVTVDLFLQDDSAGGVLETTGLSSIGVSGVASSTTFGSISAASIAAPFAPGPGTSFGSSTVDLEGVTFTPPTLPAVRIGQFTFETTALGATVFSFSDIDPAPTAANNINGDFSVVLDDDIFGGGPVNFTINAVPEPGSAVLLVVGAAALALRRRR